jgi:hypothetical protein
VTALVVFLLAGISMPLFASTNTTYATGHGCAQPVPPGVSGNPSPAPAASGVIVINEVLLTPHSTWNCSENGAYFTTTDSWLELYNTQNQPYNLYSAQAEIADNTNTDVYRMPFGTSIAAHGYLVLFPYTDALFKETITPTLKLIVNNVVVDQIAVPLLGPDQSYARTSDAASSWQISDLPTIDASNTSPLTPTPTLGGSGRSGNGRSGGSGSGSGGVVTPTPNPTKVLVSGKQPQWSTMQFPATATATATTLLQSPSSTPATVSNAGLDILRRILLTILVIAFAITLFWCWWLFKSS